MLNNFGRLALASLFVTAFAGTAVAQDDDDMGGMEDESPADDWSSDDTSSTTPEAPAATASAASGAAPQMGLLIPIFNDFGSLAAAFSGDGFSTANLLYGLDADTFLNLQLGINFGPGPDGVDGMGNPVAGDDVFGLKVGVGYRMYQDRKGKIRPYLEPSASLAIADFGNAGDVLDINLGALFGVDYALWEQFTIGAAIGANLALNDAFDSINFNLLTTGMNATFWW